MKSNRKKKTLPSIKPNKSNKLNIPNLKEPRNDNQRNIIHSIKTNIVTIIEGPAGTGKTAISASVACELLLTNKIGRIILSRPIVEAGEHLGHLPGTFEQKTSPYLYPLFAEMKEVVGEDRFNEWNAAKLIEIVPVAYMRGRTHKDCIVILDEAQNMTYKQLKLVITRIGENSKLIIDGDVNQSDLIHHRQGGLETFINKLDNLPGVGIIKMTKADIVRHPLITTMLERLGD